MARRVDVELQETITPIVDAARAAARASKDPRYSTSLGIRATAKQLNVAPSAVHGAYRHAHHSPALRAALGLPPLGPATVEVEPCPECGHAHTVDYCTQLLGPPRPRRRPAGSSPKRPRVRMPTNNAARAREILETHYPHLVVVDKNGAGPDSNEGNE